MGHLDLALKIWGAICALVGIVIGVVLGHRLARSLQREQWLVDHKIEEWREVIVVLSSSFRKMSDKYHSEPKTDETWEAIKNAAISGTEVLTNRLFIAEKLKSYGILETWVHGTNEVQQNGSTEHFAPIFRKMIELIRKSAAEDVRKP